jgi:hypothetical protein
MSEQGNELTREELEQQSGEPLPPREVMSIVDPDPTAFAIVPPKDGTIPIDTPPTD